MLFKIPSYVKHASPVHSAVCGRRTQYSFAAAVAVIKVVRKVTHARLGHLLGVRGWSFSPEELSAWKYGSHSLHR
jgi:hypothetical protein